MCDTVVFWCFRAHWWLPVRTQSSVLLLSVVLGFLIFVRILAVVGALEVVHKQKDRMQVKKSASGFLALIS